MRRDLSLFRDTDRIGKKRTAPIAGITGTLGNTRAPRQPRGFKRILQEDGEIETFATQFADKFLAAPPSLMASGLVVFQYSVYEGLVTIQVRDGWRR